MLQLDPSHRPSMSEVMAHQWMQGESPTSEEVFAEFETRNQAVRASIDSERKQKEDEKAKRVETRRN